LATHSITLTSWQLVATVAANGLAGHGGLRLLHLA
jgi:hypothetical protein